MQDVNDLRQRVIDVWVGVEHSIIDDTTSDADFYLPALEPQDDIMNIHRDIN